MQHERRRLGNAGGVEFISEELLSCQNVLNSDRGEACHDASRYAVEAVIGSLKSESRLINADGVDALLNLLETGPVSMHRQF